MTWTRHAKHHGLSCALALLLPGLALADHHEQAAPRAADSPPAPAQPGPESPAQAGPDAADPGEVARAQFTLEVVDREPVEEVSHVASDVGRVLFFTELHDLAGHTVTHRWSHGGSIQAEVPFEVGGDRWRVWSSKSLLPTWLGAWTVSVVDEDGRVLAERRLTVAEAADASEGASPEERAAPPTAARDDSPVEDSMPPAAAAGSGPAVAP